ncbi:hypothetical protein OBBRIDRAFT_886637 [Obba rivulosa]|uniref:PH domain-containing protein n=1 Tax=Obba rivulosa TaxID=1052685 RepID=A0A8E2DN28_9APHY|nr:hypothetical protein OBBRIDRAFT_886637 [Obba rivulosa]
MSRYPPFATLEGLSESLEVLPVACRFVSTDQWLVTHLQTSWTIAQVKDWLIAKFVSTSSSRLLPTHPSRRRRRPASPITFSTGQFHRKKGADTAPLYSGDAEDEFDSLDELSDDPQTRYKYTRRAREFDYIASPPPHGRSLSSPPSRTSLSDAGGLVDTARFTLISFSNGQLLEDHFNLEWYSLHPHELLELYAQPDNATISPDRLVSLPRGHVEEYIRPYYEARVRFVRLESVDADLFGLYDRISPLPGAGHDQDVETGSKHGSVMTASTDVTTRGLRQGARRKKKIGWRDRWIMVYGNSLRVYKDRNDAQPIYEAPLNALLALRGADDVRADLLHSLRAKSKPSSTTPFTSPGSSPPLLSPFSSPPLGPYTSSLPGGRRYADKHINAGRLICAQFNLGRQPPTHGLHLPGMGDREQANASDGVSVGGGWWRRAHKETPPGAVSSHGLGDYFGTRKAGYTECHSEDDLHDEKAEGEASGSVRVEDSAWFLFDVSTDGVYDGLLRVLHREAPPYCASSFLPLSLDLRRGSIQDSMSEASDAFASLGMSPTAMGKPTSFASSSRTSPPPFSLSPSYFSPIISVHATSEPRSTIGSSDKPTVSAIKGTSLPYPDWRVSVVRRARKAGLGAVGRAKELVMFGVEGDEHMLPDRAETDTKEASSTTHPPDVVGALELGSPKHEGDLIGGSQLGHPFSDDSDSSSSSSSETGDSEYEWKDWMEDLYRQRPQRGHASAVSSSAEINSPPDLAEYLQDNGIGIYNPKARAEPIDIRRPFPTPRTLSSYASADSLFKRTVHKQMSQQHIAGPVSAPGSPSHAVEFMRLRRTRSSRPSSPLAYPSFDIASDPSQLSQSDHGHGRFTQRSFEPGMLMLPPRLPGLSMTPIDQPAVSLDEDVQASPSKKGKERARDTSASAEVSRESRRRRKSSKKSTTPEDSQTKKRKKRKDTQTAPPSAVETVSPTTAPSSRPGIELPRPKLSLSPTLAAPAETPLASESSPSSGSIRFATPYISD